MKLLVIGAGMMGTSAAYDMARCLRVEEVTLADADKKRAEQSARRVRQITGQNVKAAGINASDHRQVVGLMKRHDGTLSAVPYF